MSGSSRRSAALRSSVGALLVVVLAVLVAGCGSSSKNDKRDRHRDRHRDRDVDVVAPGGVPRGSANLLPQRFVLTAGPETAALTVRPAAGTDTAGTGGTDAATEALFGCAGVTLAAAGGRSYLGPLFAAGAAPAVTLVTSWSLVGSRQLVDANRTLAADPDYARCYAQYVADLLVAGRVKVDGVATATAAAVRGARTVPAPDGAAVRLDALLDVTGPAGVVPVHVVVVPVLDRAVASTLVVTRPTAAPETSVVDAAAAQLVRKVTGAQ